LLNDLRVLADRRPPQLVTPVKYRLRMDLKAMLWTSPVRPTQVSNYFNSSKPRIRVSRPVL